MAAKMVASTVESWVCEKVVVMVERRVLRLVELLVLMLALKKAELRVGRMDSLMVGS